MKALQIIVLLVVLIFAVIITWLNLSWRTIEQLVNTPSDTRIDYYLSDFTLTQTDAKGDIQYQLMGQHLTHQQKDRSSDIYQPRIQARSSEDGELLTIHADKADQSGKDGTISLTGDVVMLKPANESGIAFTLKAQSLVYNPNTKLMTSDADILFQNNNGILTGKGFETHLDEQELRILSNVQAEFAPSQ